MNELFWLTMLNSIRYLESTCTSHQTVKVQTKIKQQMITVKRKRGKEKQKLKKNLPRSCINLLDRMVGVGVTLER